MYKLKFILLVIVGFMGVFLAVDTEPASASDGWADLGSLNCNGGGGAISCFQRTSWTAIPYAGCFYHFNSHIDWGGAPWRPGVGSSDPDLQFKTGEVPDFDWAYCNAEGWIRLPSNTVKLEYLAPPFNLPFFQVLDVSNNNRVIFNYNFTRSAQDFRGFWNFLQSCCGSGGNNARDFPESAPYRYNINISPLAGRTIRPRGQTRGVWRIQRDESPPAKPVLSVRPTCSNANTPSTRRVDEVSWTSGGNGANHTLIAWHGSSIYNMITVPRGNATFYKMGEGGAYPTNFSGTTVTYRVQAEKNGHRVLSDPVGANHRCFHRTILTNLYSGVSVNTGGARTFTVNPREYENGGFVDKSFSVASSNPLIRVARVGNSIRINATTECGHDGGFATITLSSSGFSSIRRNVYIKNTCSSEVLGDVGAGGDVEGIKVGDNSIIAATEITNITGRPTEVRHYSEEAWSNLVAQQKEVIKKLKSEKAKTLPVNGISGQFNLSTGNSDNRIDSSNPDGGVWFVEGDVRIGGTQWCGKGTIIIEGTLTIPTNMQWTYNGLCPNSSLGIIADKIAIEKGAQVVGSFFASKNITINGTNVITRQTTVKGVLASEEITLVDQGIRIEYDGRVTSNPPLGFSESIAPIIRAGIR